MTKQVRTSKNVSNGNTMPSIKEQRNGLKNGNKVCKSLSGCLKVIAATWSDGYKSAFSPYLSYQVINGRNVKDVLAACMTETDGTAYYTATRAVLDKDGNKTEQRETYHKVIVNWSPNALYRTLKEKSEQVTK